MNNDNKVWLWFFCLLFITLTVTIRAAEPSLINITNLNDGELISGAFTICSAISGNEPAAKVAIKAGNGPWEAVLKTAPDAAAWNYTINTRQIVIGEA